MPDFYLLAVAVLCVLAVGDLIVGVSNDAVNFLNSSFGSRVGSRRLILTIASLGILLGATFSSGMMEIARKGVFNPGEFVFAEIMVIFLAVMLTDILLLDLFNTLGMPTSTTVSIVFELLGAAVVISLIKLNQNGESLANLGRYINSAKAMAIMGGIFVSVGIAFTVGSLVQFFSRWMFTFDLDKRQKWVTALWSALAMTSMSYFLFFKGLGGASFIGIELLNWVNAHMYSLVLLTLLFWGVVMWLLISVFKVSILRLVVLFGTFALAMAFAGNDLVNFIGVPLAGLDSFIMWRAEGVPAESFRMTALNQPVQMSTTLLVLAGIIMTLTLWFSKKAHTVTETEINLGRQNSGLERFAPNRVSRLIVRSAITGFNRIWRYFPQRWKAKLADNFDTSRMKHEDRPPAFDLLRASVNLVAASVLIALATTLKLPLSTTYVSFMVAMGTSLADKAWGRDSAVYRIAGVMQVISGWFITAAIAFTAAAILAALLYYFQIWALLAIVISAMLTIRHTWKLHKSKLSEKEKIQGMELIGYTDLNEAQGSASTWIRYSLAEAFNVYHNALSGVIKENRSLVDMALDRLQELDSRNRNFRYQLISDLREREVSDARIGRLYLYVYDLEQDLLESLSSLTEKASEYVHNMLSPLDVGQTELLQELTKRVEYYLKLQDKYLNRAPDVDYDLLYSEKKSLLNWLNTVVDFQMNSLHAGSYSIRNHMLFMDIHLHSKDIVAISARLLKLWSGVEASKNGSPEILSHPDSGSFQAQAGPVS